MSTIRKLVEAVYDLIGGPGPRSSAIARTKFIDDLIEARDPSTEQLVILGAGYDCRPYRLKSLSHCLVFEVDHPATQIVKRRALTHVSTRNVTFVPVDFERDDLSAELMRSGYSKEKTALFLWEGVTNYLTGEAVDATLAVVRELSIGGNLLVFTYVDQAVIVGDYSRFPEAAKWVKGVRKRGEPWTFGIWPDNTRTFLAERGFQLIEDISAADLGARYFSPLGRSERGSGLYRVALASVM